jgi:hypothetical protein
MHLDFYSWRCYNECPKHYRLQYVDQVPPPYPENKYFALYGNIMQRFFEMYSNNWGKSDTCPMPDDLIKERLKTIFDSFLKTEYIVWGARFANQSGADILQDSFVSTRAILSSPNKEYFLNTSSEVPITLETKDEDVISVKIDFVHTVSENVLNKRLLIFDGKGTKKLGNVWNDQVYLYALIYFFHTKIMPSSLGFFYYRFNTFVPVEITMDILNLFRAKLSLSLKTIKADLEFKANPCTKSCKYCGYQTDCQEYIHRPKRKKKNNIPVTETTGLAEFGF